MSRLRALRCSRWAMMVAVLVFGVLSAGAETGAKTQKPPKKKLSIDSFKLTKLAAARDQRAKIAHLKLSGQIVNSPPGFSLFTPSQQATVRTWLHRLALVRTDERIHAVALEIGTPQLSWAQAQELSDAIRRLSSVRPVHAHLVQGGTLAYLLASSAREVTMEPTGQLMIVGLGAELTFFRGTLSKLGIEPQFVQIGRYKGASEPMVRTAPSKELRGEYDKILDDLYDQLCGQIARGRKLKVAAVTKAIDAGPFSARSALAHKLVDRLESKADWVERLRREVAGKGPPAQWAWNHGKSTEDKLDLSNPLSLLDLLIKGGKSKKIADPSIAIVHADGMIVTGRSGQSVFGGRLVGSETLAKCFQDIAEDDRIKGVVFRIDSPGGSALASELIYQAVRRCAKKKPVVASIAQTGASGGYYIAAGAKTILADPCAITGSIGVVSGKLAIKGLYEKIGVTTFELTRGRNAGLGMSRPWRDEEKAVIRKLAQETYDQFLARVKASRGKRIAKLDAVAQGRIFTARQAVGNGLIDSLGGLRDAVNLVKAEAKIDNCGFVTLPAPRTLMDMLTGRDETDSPAGAVLGEGVMLRRWLALSPGATYLLDVLALMRREHVLAAMPHHVSIRN